ncbi:Transcription initiation factor TFIID subunit 7 [Glycine soja]|uniref:Transcription initiation factor TFIID subunit 7 n=1 Tax=Glycine soja TaxID=3848 RepID=A0A445H508_GLYSO|nr:Transcription initiation factor TFIID subunit 7 [Glycine soja]
MKASMDFTCKVDSTISASMSCHSSSLHTPLGVKASSPINFLDDHHLFSNMDPNINIEEGECRALFPTSDLLARDPSSSQPPLHILTTVSKHHSTITTLCLVMEEQFILRVPPNVAERIERLLNENNASSSEDKSLDLSFREDGRSGTFMIGNEQFPASLLDLPCVVESYKTYDDNSLIKTADIGQMIMVRESGDAAPDVIEYRHGLTPPMRDARKRRFRREPDLNPELVSRVEKDLLKIMAGGTADNLDILTSFCPPDSGNKLNFGYFLDRNSHVETAEQEEGDENARGANKKSAPKPAPKHDIPENLTNAGEADRSDSEESDDSV